MDDARQTLWWPLPIAGTVLCADLLSTPSVHRHVALLALASALLLLGAVRGRLSTTVLLATAVPVALVAVAKVPDGTDLWSYQAQGRVLAVHHSNPYTTPPSAYPDDPVTARVNPIYLDALSVYGPVFSLAAGVVAAVTGTGELLGRLAWQLLAVAAVAAAAFALRRRWAAAPVAIALVLLQPVTVDEVLHLAHNDAIVGLLVLAACWAAGRERPVPAGLLFGAAALVKAPAIVALIAYLVWLVARGERRDAARSAGSALALALITVVPFGPRAVLDATSAASSHINATSIWHLARGHWQMFVHRPLVEGGDQVGTVLRIAAIAVPIAVAVTAAYRLRHRPVHEAVTVALVAWMVFGLSAASWYLWWALPLLALWSGADRVALLLYACLVQITSQAWLMPVAALITTGHLELVDRLPALLLGLTTVLGLALLVLLVRTRPADDPDITIELP